ncbi:hypothetical protein BH20ACT9_BH20ACT9_00900 [soil metagenome]
MTRVWVVVALMGAGTVALKGAGPALLGGRRLPGRLADLVDMGAPALLAALVVTQVFADERALVLDARAAGLAAAGVALWLRAPVLATIAVAAAVAAATRALL